MSNRQLIFRMENGKDVILPLGKIVYSTANKESIYFDKMPNGTWRVIVNERIIPDIDDIDEIEFLK